MNLVAIKVIAGLGTAAAISGGSYFAYELFSPKTLGDELYRNDGLKILSRGDGKWREREEKHKSNDGTLSFSKINGLEIVSDSNGGLENKCYELWNSEKNDVNKNQKIIDIKNWCLEK